MNTSAEHLYLIGIGGVGMVWIADWALTKGVRVSGSDMQESDNTRRLSEAGVNIHIGTDPSVIPADITRFIINSAITPTSPSFPQLQEAERRGLPIQKRAQYVGEISKNYTTLSIAGTHGKTTTTTMVGWILEKAGLDPTVFVGGSVAAWGDKTRIGKSEYLVLESDEFDRSFHQFHPAHAIILNIDADHLDYYKNGLDEITESFQAFANQVTGTIIAYDSPTTRAAITAATWYDESHLWPSLKLPLPGKHLLLNATAAALLCSKLGVPDKTIHHALATFPGVGRRFEFLGKRHTADLYDDYAHHPREVAATLQAFREQYPDQKIAVVFQPHQKARTEALFHEFATCFSHNSPDTLILAPIYEVAGRETTEGITITQLGQAIRQNFSNTLQVATTNEELHEAITKALSAHDAVLCAGAGSIRTLINAWFPA